MNERHFASNKEVMMKRRFSHKSQLLGSVLLLAALSFWSKTVGAGGDAAAGARTAMYCAYCHGPDGNSTYTGAPRLAGQRAESFVAKMQLYKTNKKVTHPVMAFLTGGRNGGLNDQDIQNLAAFYTAQPVRQNPQLYNGPPPIK
jgi:cytochrome c553